MAEGGRRADRGISPHAANRDRRAHRTRQPRTPILSSKWICTICGGKSFIERKNPGYQITCMSCEKTAWGSHKSLWEVLNK